MITPKNVFENPSQYIDFITFPTDDDFESQNFDRKSTRLSEDDKDKAKKQLIKLKKQVMESISAFTNANREGGLLVLGVNSSGDVEGINQFSEEQVNSITDFNALLRNQTSRTNTVFLQNKEETPCKVLLIFTPYSENGICETLGNSPKAWMRSGTQNLPMTEDMKDQLKRDKRIIEFERSYCCDFDINDLFP